MNCESVTSVIWLDLHVYDTCWYHGYLSLVPPYLNTIKYTCDHVWRVLGFGIYPWWVGQCKMWTLCDSWPATRNRWTLRWGSLTELIFRFFFYKCILGFFEFCVLAFIVLAFIVLLPRPHSILIIPSMCLYWWYCPPTCWLLYVRILPVVLTQYASAHFDFTHRYIYNILYFDVKFLGVTFSAYSEF